MLIQLVPSVAGSYGKDVRGLNRLHQFNVEIVRIDKPEHSYDSLKEDELMSEGLVTKLNYQYITF